VRRGLQLRSDVHLQRLPARERTPDGNPVMPSVIGIVLSLGVAGCARYVGFDRDRAFYPTVMIVIASYYVLFAVMSGSIQTVVIESVVMTLFAAAAVAGFKSSAWIVVAALAGHGVFDAVHGHVIENVGMPAWWPAWCLAYDVVAGAGHAWSLIYSPSASCHRPSPPAGSRAAPSVRYAVTGVDHRIRRIWEPSADDR
jgi:hypothetical protein